MLIVPGLPPLQQTQNSRELAKRLEETVRAYHRDHPEMTEDEIRAALAHSSPGDSREVIRRKRAFGVGLMAAIVGAFTAVASNGGRFPLEGDAWKIAGGVAAVGVVAITLVVLARRG